MRKLKKSTTNIQRISVSAWQMPGEAGYPAYTKKLPVQTNLTSIEFKVYRLSRKRSLGFHAFQPLLQILLDSAPNLTSLDVISPFYPNLEGCKKLKVLKFMPYVFQNFDLAAEIGMLAQVKESLIEMELRYVGDKMIEMPRQSQNLDVPVMSKLVSLTIYPPIMYLFQDFFHEDHLPALKSLILTTKYFRSAGFESHLNLWKRHRGVQSIKLQLDSLTQMDANALGRQIVGLFPSVKKFELISYLGWTNSIQGINQMMTPYQNWNLEEGNVFGDGINASSTFFAVLENMAKWKGVKRVHFKYQRSTRDAFFAAIKDLNLQSRGFKSVKISDYNRITITDPEILEVLTDF
ncbi:uncharacterized protein LOC118438032 [Folsomia candida]|nr:uncharacterized protein LOC118438032 [Folsomia candida]